MIVDEITRDPALQTESEPVAVDRSPMRVMVMPRDPNPYQELLHAELGRRAVETRYVGELTASRTLNLLLLPVELMALRMRGWRLLHVHWLFHFDLRAGLPIPGVRRLAALWFALVLAVCRLAGIRVVWTAHNVLPHEPIFSDDVRARRRLVANAAVVVAHSTATVTALDELGIKPSRSLIAPHPAYPVPPPARLSPRTSGARFVLAGTIASYKGVEDLVDAFTQLPHPTARLTVAGRCDDVDLTARLEQRCAADSRITLRLGRLTDDELVAVVREATYVVLPYRKVTTSGVAMLALSAGRPLIVPDHAGFADLPSEAVRRYRADGNGGLAGALRAALLADPVELALTSRAAERFASERTWDASAEQVWRAYRMALDAPRQSRAIAGELESTATNLLLNLVFASFAGFAATIVLTHVFTPSQVGLGSVAISLSGIAATFSQLGLDYSILRYLPRSDRPEQLVNTTITVGSLVTIGVSGAILAIPSASSRLLALGILGVTTAFVIGNVMNSLQAQLELILVAKQRSRAVWRLNIPANLSKLAFPFAFVWLGALGVYVSQAASITLSVLLMAYALARAGVRYRPSVNLAAAGEMWRFSMGAFVAGLAGSAPLYVLPLIIVARFGSRANAFWFAAMAIAMAIYQLASTISQALLAQASRLPDERRAILARGARLTLLIMLPTLAVGYVAAPWVLALFGHHYSSQGATVLRWLLVSGIAVSMNFVTGAVLYLDKRTGLITSINVVNAVIVLVLSLFAATDLTGVGKAWAVGELSNVVLFGAAAWWLVRRRRGRWELLGEPA